jgi:hypothetical protein
MQLFKPFLFTGRMLSILVDVRPFRVDHHITGQLQDHVFIQHFKKYVSTLASGGG